MNRLLFVAIFMVVASPALSSGLTYQTDTESLEGMWQLVSAVYNGKESPAKEKVIWQLTKTHITYSSDLQDTYTVDPKASPKSITITQIRPKDKVADGKKLLGIYQVKGDTLEICVAEADKGLPKEFKSTPGSGHNLLTLKRTK
jgi:uncharacterized protein (TIGR03067 family)